MQQSAFGAEQDATPELLWESQERFQRAFDDSAIGMVIVGLDGRFLEVNRTFCSMLGFSESELRHTTLPDIIHPEDRLANQKVIRRTLSGQLRIFDLELRYIDKCGQSRWARVVASIARDVYGQPLYLIGQFQNISAQKQAEEDLRQTLAKYRTLVEQIPVSTYITAADDVGQLLYQSPQIARLLGYSPEEWLATPDAWRAHVHPDDFERVVSSDAQSSASGDAYSLEYRFFTRDGRTVWVRDEGQLVRDDLGNPVCWQGITIDITRQKQAEDQLRMQQAILTSLTEGSLDGIVVNSDSGTVLAANQQFLKLWNISEPDIVGTSSAALHEYCVAQVADQVDAQAGVDDLNRRREAADRKELLLKDGRTLDRFSCPAVGPDGAYYGRVWYYRDITERSRIEQELMARERQLAEAQRLAGLGSWGWDVVSGNVHWSDEGFRILGFEPGSVQPTFDLFLSLVNPHERERVARALDATLKQGIPYQLDITVCRPDGTERILQSHGEVVTDQDGAPTGMRGTMLDVTVRKELEARLASQALQDPLTGLPNRRSLSQRLDQALERSRSEGASIGLLFVDIDNFKDVNDQFGHDAGDDVLIDVAERLQSCIREQDVAVRLGGDEFVVLLDDVSDIGAVIQVAERLLARVSMPIHTSVADFTLTASIGIVMSDSDTLDAEELLQGSDAAMYSAKSRGKARWVADCPLP